MRGFLILLMASAAIAGDDIDARLARIENRLDALEKRLDRIEGFVNGLQAVLEPKLRFEQAKTEDMNRVRGMTTLLTIGPGVPFDKAGRVDVFAIVRRGDVDEQSFDIFRSSRFETKLTNEQIKKGDHTHFPYGRYKRVEGQKLVGDTKVLPVIWDLKPDAGNGRVVGLSSGAVKWMPEADFQALLKAAKQVEKAAR